MALLTTVKNLVLGVLLACAFSSFILSIIYTNRQIEDDVGYNPAVIAFLVVGIVQTLYIVFQLASRMRGNINKTMIPFSIHTLVTLYYLGVAITFTVKRYDAPHYCPAGIIRDVTGCLGLYKALMAIAWIDFGLNLIYLALLAMAASKYGGFGVEEGHLYPAEDLERQAVADKAGH